MPNNPPSPPKKKRRKEEFFFLLVPRTSESDLTRQMMRLSGIFIWWSCKNHHPSNQIKSNQRVHDDVRSLALLRSVRAGRKKDQKIHTTSSFRWCTRSAHHSSLIDVTATLRNEVTYSNSNDVFSTSYSSFILCFWKPWPVSPGLYCIVLYHSQKVGKKKLYSEYHVKGKNNTAIAQPRCTFTSQT